ncbi:proto-oncogene Mas-like [Ambystoma mexicanum]|uniref:proto-oncogene Mas-like n=1 Tax=Ambystoma mexicanum TaxID=8296 RepID=UPI0037E93074
MFPSPPTVTQENWTIWWNDSQLEMPAIKTVLNSMCLLVCILGLAGNGIVFFCLGIQIKRNKFTVYILNLSVADFMFLLCVFISKVLLIVSSDLTQFRAQQPDLENILKVLTSVLVASLFGYNASIYLLTAISVERCLSVFCPIWYQCSRPKHQSAVVCCLLWMLSCLLNAAEFFICEQQTYVSQAQGFLTRYSERCTFVYFSIGFLNFLVFTPLMVFSSVTLLIKVKRDSWKQHPSKLYLVIVATVILFLIFGMPIRVILQLKHKDQSLLPVLSVHVAPLLSSINSSVNPYVYWFVGRREGGKCSFQMILQRIFREDTKEHKQKQHSKRTAGKNGAQTMV